MGYYDRAGGLATDGTPTFATRQDAESEREVAALFIVRFSDGLRYLPVAEVDASALRVGGCRQRVKSVSDVEPVIEVPVAGMRVV